MIKMSYSIVIAVLLAFLGCGTESEPINYGKDQCSHCRMTIVDKKYGSEIVTSKGKIFKFDAAECTVNFIRANSMNQEELQIILVTDVTQPEKFTDARSASYLISPKLRSPMGENISAFESRQTAEKYRADLGGDIYDWAGIIQLLGSR